MRARNAKLPDAFAIEQLIQVHVGDGTLLPRSLKEICENIRDFIENLGYLGILHDASPTGAQTYTFPS